MAFTISVHSPEACRIDSRSTIQGINLQSSVVGETIYAVVLMNIECLLQRVALQSVSCFGDVLCAANIVQTFHCKGIAQYLLDFFQFVGIVGGHDQFTIHNSQFINPPKGGSSLRSGAGGEGVLFLYRVKTFTEDALHITHGDECLRV